MGSSDCCIRGALQKSDGAGDRVVVTTGDRGRCSGNRDAAASAEATWCLISLVRRVAQQASVRTTSTIRAIVSARDGALSLSPNLDRLLTGLGTSFVLALALTGRSRWRHLDSSPAGRRRDSDRPARDRGRRQARFIQVFHWP